MKCPECGYIGFEPAERCPDCGVDLRRAVTPAAPEDLALRLDDALEPAADLPLGPDLDGPPRVRVRPAPGRRPDAGGEGDLPLFGAGDPAVERTSAPWPAPRAPLAVRRTPPAVARPKPRAPVTPPLPSLDLEPDRVERPPAGGDPPTETRALAPGTGRRFASAALDAALLVGVDLVIVYFTLRVCRLTAAEIDLLPLAPMIAFLALVNGGYLWAFTAAGGQTIGKMALGLRAVDRRGAPVTAGRAAVRAALSLVASAPLGVGLLPCILGGGRRALHDWLAGSAVERVADQ